MNEDVREGIIPLASGLHRDGTIHIYTDEKDSGMRIELDVDGVLVIHPEDNPADDRKSFPCPFCDGNIVEIRQGEWQCDKCNFDPAGGEEEDLEVE